MLKHYPWKSSVLRSWLETEVRSGKTLRRLSDETQIHRDILWGWLMLSSQTITLEDIQLIAQYRHEDFEATMRWLGICSAHLEALIVSDSNRIETSRFLRSNSAESLQPIFSQQR